MSFVTVREFFLKMARDLKYRGHAGFVWDNIPSTVLDKSVHVSAFQFGAGSQNQMDVPFQIPVTVRLFFKGYADEDKTISTATAAGEAYIEKVLASENRLGQPKIRNVVLDTMVVEPYATSNDNSVICRIEFTAILYKGIC